MLLAGATAVASSSIEASKPGTLVVRKVRQEAERSMTLRAVPPSDAQPCGVARTYVPCRASKSRVSLERLRLLFPVKEALPSTVIIRLELHELIVRNVKGVLQFAKSR
jgi:hypothetical protein